jgi:hypothetical protein
VLADTPWVHVSGTWGPGVILFESQDGHIYRVAATGGKATALDTLSWEPGKRTFASPRFLPDGRHFLVTVVADPALYVASLDAPACGKSWKTAPPPCTQRATCSTLAGQVCSRGRSIRNGWSPLEPRCR